MMNATWLMQVRVMSTINNIPFDINVTPTERNVREKLEGAAPVIEAEAIHPVNHFDKHPEKKQTIFRHKLPAQVTEQEEASERQTSGSVIEEFLPEAHIKGEIVDIEA